MKHSFLLATIAMITVKISFSETYSFIKIMQPISPNYNWENGVKQIKITEENLSQICILCDCNWTRTPSHLVRKQSLNHLAELAKLFVSIAMAKDPSIMLKMHQTFFFCFYHCLPYICWLDVIYLTCLAFLKSPWLLVWIFCPPTPLT